MATLTIAIMQSSDYEAFCAKTAAIETSPASQPPVMWFTSVVSLAKILSDTNRDLLGLIANNHPASIQELAVLTGKPKSTLARALATLERHGFIAFEKGDGRARRPVVSYHNIQIHIPLI
jgi:predicted transcriptional regulator